MDGTVLPERQFSRQWDGPWRGASAVAEGGWSAEMFIPWSMMTMPDVDGDTREIGFYISREVAYKNERWGWPALPRTKSVFMSRLQKMELRGIEPKQQFTFYPYASTTYDNVTEQDTYKAGFDFFWRPSSNLQLTSTINPDFGNVESDNVVVNLTSFETFFPEKRPFFLEGQDIFITSPRARQGRFNRGPPTTLVNTRRIGSPPRDPDITGLELPDLEKNQPSELQGAVKMTGQNGKFRYGVLAAIEDDTKLKGTINGSEVDTVQVGRDFGITRFLYENTSGGGRRSVGWISTIVAHPRQDAVTHGLDGHYLSSDGRLNADIQLLYSDVDDVTGAGGFLDIKYTPKQGRKHIFEFDYFNDDLDINDFGFLRRNDAIGARYFHEITESNLPNFKSRFTKFGVSQEYNTDGKVVRSGILSFRDREFKNNSFLFTELNYFPERWDDTNSDGNGSFKIHDRWQTGFFWANDQARKLNLGVGVFYTGADLGGRTMEYNLELTWRPTDRFSFILNLGYEDLDGWLVHDEGRDFTTFSATNWRPRIETDFFFSAKQQFRITAQWIGIKAFEQDRWQVPLGDGRLDRVTTLPGTPSRDFSISRLVFQARYRWEIAPLSDLFVVYTRGSNVPSDPSRSFDNLLRDSWTDPAVDVFVIKLRYRLGS
ncbi:MAG: DUF5916 domain-containing protein [Gammaproteobacteria bacterium]|nr:DUF5916 domain-containing protein [Gammaproteobacteria bacterium]